MFEKINRPIQFMVENKVGSEKMNLERKARSRSGAALDYMDPKTLPDSVSIGNSAQTNSLKNSFQSSQGKEKSQVL